MHDVLFGNLGLRSIEGVGGLGGEPLAQSVGKFWLAGCRE